jgi:hypothetical protein
VSRIANIVIRLSMSIGDSVEPKRSRVMTIAKPAPLAAFGKPLDLHLVDGEVVFLGPGNIAFSMTVGAARRTSARLDGLLAGIAESRKTAGA